MYFPNSCNSIPIYEGARKCPISSEKIKNIAEIPTEIGMNTRRLALISLFAESFPFSVNLWVYMVRSEIEIAEKRTELKLDSTPVAIKKISVSLVAPQTAAKTLCLTKPSSFITNTIDKLKVLRKVYKGRIEVDGGINDETISLVKEYVDSVVSGSYVCLSDDCNEKIAKLKK